MLAWCLMCAVRSWKVRRECRQLSKWRYAKVAILYSQWNLTEFHRQPMQFVYQWCYAHGLAYVSSQQAVLRWSEPSALYLFVLQTDRPWLSCSGGGGSLRTRRQVLLKRFLKYAIGWTQSVLIFFFLKTERERGATNAADLILNGESLVNVNCEVFHRSFNGVLLLAVSAESLSTSLRPDEAPTPITSVLSMFNMSLLLFIQTHWWQMRSQYVKK